MDQPAAQPKPLSIVVLISGSGTNLQAIIEQIQQGNVHAEIKAVISNRPNVKGLQRAAAASIPAHVLNHQEYDTREDFDLALQQLIDGFKPELVVLAGFMRILTADFVEHFANRMMNIHPSLLPLFRGLNTHQRALDAGHKQHGVSVHFVTNELDSGPVVLQAVVDILKNDNADTLAARIHQQEHIIYPMVIGWYADRRLSCDNNITRLDGSQLTTPAKWINQQLRLN